MATDARDKDTLMLIKYTADEDRLEKILENPQVIKTPVVRNGKQSTLGYQPESAASKVTLSGHNCGLDTGQLFA